MKDSEMRPERVNDPMTQEIKKKDEAANFMARKPFVMQHWEVQKRRQRQGDLNNFSPGFREVSLTLHLGAPGR